MEHTAFLLHVMSAFVFTGLSVVSYFYLLQKYYKNYLTSDTSLRTLVITDALIVFPLILLTITSAMLIPIPTDNYFSITWIFSSCIYLSLAVACLTISIFMKMYYYFRAKMTGIYRLTLPFHLINILQLILFLAITHDMVTKQSWLNILLQSSQ